MLGKCWEGQYRSCSQRRPLVGIHGRLCPAPDPRRRSSVQSPGAATGTKILSTAKGLCQTGPEVTPLAAADRAGSRAQLLAAPYRACLRSASSTCAGPARTAVATDPRPAPWRTGSPESGRGPEPVTRILPHPKPGHPEAGTCGQPGPVEPVVPAGAGLQGNTGVHGSPTPLHVERRGRGAHVGLDAATCRYWRRTGRDWWVRYSRS
jgi:hypothetical protein